MSRTSCALNIMRSKQDSSVRLPVYGTTEAAAADCYLPEAVTIEPNEIKKIPLGICFDIPKGFCIKMYPRSSLLIKKGLMMPVSIIDSDYHGEVSAPVVNLTNEAINLDMNERICQIMLEEVIDINNLKREHVKRDQNGFGGTGR